MNHAWIVVALQASSPMPVVDTGIDAVRAIVALVAVAAALAGFLWLLKRGTFSMRRGSRQVLAIESAMSLGDRRSLIIVSVEGRRLLLGVSQSQVSLLTELAHKPSDFGTALDQAASAPERRTS